MTEPHDPGLDAAFRELLTGALDDGPMCECRCAQGPHPHADRWCGRRATTHVALHMWGCCDQPDALTPEAVDPDGNLCILMCGPCSRTAEGRAAATVRHLLATIDTPACPTCGRPTVTTSDLFQARPI